MIYSFYHLSILIADSRNGNIPFGNYTSKTQERNRAEIESIERILVTNIRVSHLAAQAPHVDGKVITCHEQSIS